MAVLEVSPKDIPIGSIIVGRSLEYQVLNIVFEKFEDFAKSEHQTAYCYSVMDKEQLNGRYIVIVHALDSDRIPAAVPTSLGYLATQKVKIEETE